MKMINIGNNTASLIGMTLSRSVTAEQINANQGAGQLRRGYEIESINEEARTVELAFSSETPVMRWFGEEILSHDADAIHTDRLDRSAALLVNHDPDDLVGVIESHRIDSDRIARAVVRFGTSDRANEIWADVVSGIRCHVSVGYSVKGISVEEREGQPDLVTITEWEPYEISLVSIPADINVGVGRSLGEPPEEDGANNTNTDPTELQRSIEGSEQMKVKILRNAQGDLVRAKVDDEGKIVEQLEILERANVTSARVAEGTASERQRVADIMELGNQYNAGELAATHIRDGGSVDDMTRALLDHVNEGANNTRTLSDGDGSIGLTEAEADNFSFIRAIRALANPNDRRIQEAAAFEMEASRAAAQEMNRDAQGIMVPMDVLRRALNTGTDGLTPGSTGGLTIANDLATGSFIQMLRNRSVFLDLVTPMGGLVGNMDIPGQLSGSNGFWLGEDDDASEGNQEFRQISMSPKTAGAYSEVTRKMLQQSSIDNELLMRMDLARGLAQTIDLAGYYGTGTGDQPLGIKNLPGINAVSFAAANPTFQELVDMETEISADNADVDSMAYIANARFRGHAKTKEKFGGTSGQTIWEQGGTVNGYRTEITNQTVDGDVFFGNWADVVAGMWGGLDLTVDQYSQSKKGKITIVAFQDIDFAHRNVESFCYGTGP